MLAQQSAPAVSPPPALPLSATERVLELSLEQAIQLALQNNLEIERGRLDPQVAHAQVEQERAVFDPSVGLDGKPVSDQNPSAKPGPLYLTPRQAQ